MKRDNVQFALVSALQSLSDLDIPANEESLELVPLRHQVFQMVTRHQRSLFV